MPLALIYLGRRAIFRVVDFFHHWYGDASKVLFHGFLSTLERADRYFAFRVTARHFFEPLYQDYSVVGRILGVFFRSVRLGLASVIYLILGTVWGAIFAAWYALPLILLYYAVKP